MSTMIGRDAEKEKGYICGSFTVEEEMEDDNEGEKDRTKSKRRLLGHR